MTICDMFLGAGELQNIERVTMIIRDSGLIGVLFSLLGMRDLAL